MTEPRFRHLRCRREQDVLVLTLTAPHLQGDDLADFLREELHAAVSHHEAAKVVLDFEQVRHLGSAGFRPLLSLFRRLRQAGGRMVLCNLSGDVEDVLHVTRLVSSSRTSTAPFERAADLDAALGRLHDDALAPSR